MQVTSTTTRQPARRLWPRMLFYVAAAVVVLVLAAWFGGRWYLARSVAPYEGEVAVAGLTAPVEVTFDAMGVPQLWARTDADAYAALGWLHAAERLFQMELTRRMAAGTLSEVFGAIAFETDVRQRQIGFRRRAAAALPALTARSRTLLEAYTRGINARLATAPVLPPEFVVLGLRPAPWTPLDVLTVQLFQSWFTGSLMDGNSATEQLARALGAEVAAALLAAHAWSAPTVPQEGLAARLVATDGAPLRMTNASNTWVVAPARSASGAALHASDPHLAINEVPGLWYLAGLHSDEGLDVVGVTAPGLPLVGMGHNGRASWAFTVAPLDQVDYFEEMLDAADTTRVLTPDGYRPMVVHVEEVRVKGEKAPRRVPVYTTPRGVLVERTGDRGRSLRWAGFDADLADAVDAGFDLHHVADFAAFRETVLRLQPFSVNWSYADRRGNIGYQFGARVPRRTYNPLVLQQAADTTARWDGYHDAARSPHALNPARGWLASTNNQAAPPEWPVPLPGFYNLHRIRRAEAWLTGQARFGRAEMERMQEDQHSALAEAWKPLMAEGAARRGDAALAARVAAWDGRMAAEDTLAGVFALWWRALPRHVFEDELGEAWPDGQRFLEVALTMPAPALLDDRRTPDVEDAADVAARALDEALTDARGRPLGAIQTLTVRHLLADVPLLDRWLRLNRGPFPRGGDSGSLDATWYHYDPETASLAAAAGPSMRYVMDWSDPDAFTIQTALGQSGNPFSPHYDDFLALNRRGERWVVPFSREAVHTRQASRLRLVPGAG